jgi:hypothetical protein
MLKLKSLLREDPASDIKDLVTKVKNYREFVAKLGDLVKDPKVRAFIKSGRSDGEQQDDKINAVSKILKVADLRPTQNEIDVQKSLNYPLTYPEMLQRYLGKEPVTIKAPIVTYNGKYIIDGHHRWSQVYSMNPHAIMTAVDLEGTDMNPVDLLKVVQLSIAGELGTVPTATVKGENLLKVSADVIAKYVVDTIKDECVKVFRKMCGAQIGHQVTKDTIAGKVIVPNIKEMQKYAQPMPGAPSRDLMPQTDEAPNSLKDLTKGIVNYNEPYTQESVNRKLDTILKETYIRLK